MKDGFGHIKPSPALVQSCIFCENNTSVNPAILQSPPLQEAILSGIDLLGSQLLSPFLFFTGRACITQEGGFCIHSPTVGAQRLGLAAEEIHWQAWGVSGPTTGLFSALQDPGGHGIGLRLQAGKLSSSLAYIKENSPWWIERQDLTAPLLSGCRAHHASSFSVFGQCFSVGLAVSPLRPLLSPFLASSPSLNSYLCL